MGMIINPYMFGSFVNTYYAAFGGTNEYAIKSGFSPNGYTQLTVSIWMRTSSALTNNYFISFPQSSAGTNGCDLYQSAGGAIRGTLKTTTGLTLDTGIAYNDNAWHNILLWYDGANARIYVDNVQRATAAKTGTISLTANETNIARFGSFGLYMVTNLDEISVWNLGLDASGRTALYNSGTPGNLATHPNFANCTAWWRWTDTDDMTGTTGVIADQIGSNDLTPFNTEVTDKVAY